MKTVKKEVVLVGLTFSGFCAYGLGYLKAHAYKQASIKNNYQIKILEFDGNEDSKKIVKEVLKKRPNILGFTVHHGLEAKISDISNIIKSKIKALLVIWGGTEVSNSSEAVLKRNRFVDVIVRGEGEITFTEILKRHVLRPYDFEDIEGITYRQGKEIIYNPDRRPERNLDNFPSPYLSKVLDPERYTTAHMETYRGCPFKCRYCYEYRGFKDIRFFSTDRIKKELTFLLKTGIRGIKFFDTTFTWGKKRVTEILEYLAKNNKNATIYAETVGELLDEEIINLMKKAGFLSLEIGIQTINRKTLKNIGRLWYKKRFEENIECLLKYKITPIIHIMGGLPGDNLINTKETINYVFSLGATPHLFLTKILSGTQFEKIAKDFEINFLHYGLHDTISNSTYSAEDIIKYKNIMMAHNRCLYIINSIPTLAKELRIKPADFYEKFSIWARNNKPDSKSLLQEISEFLQKEYNNIDKNKREKIMDFIRYCEHEFKARELIYYGFRNERIPYDSYAFTKFNFDFSNLEMSHPRLVNLQNIKDKKAGIIFVRKYRDIRKTAISLT